MEVEAIIIIIITGIIIIWYYDDNYVTINLIGARPPLAGDVHLHGGGGGAGACREALHVQGLECE